MSVQRKLAAILAADVVGFSRLTGADEDRTLARLRALRSDVIDPTIAVHNGRVVKRTGDGVLVEFRSVVDAVRCAIEIQNAMVERNAGVPAERRIEFRIGIHLGDVVEESDGDLMGDGVNIAARLEGIASPGAICLSEDAYRQVQVADSIFWCTIWGTPISRTLPSAIKVYSLQVGVAAPIKAEPQAPEPAAEEPLAGQAFDRRAALHQHVGRSRAGILRRRHGRGHHHRAVALQSAASSSRAIPPSPTRAAPSTSARSRGNWACAMCSRAASASRATGSASPVS